MNPPPDILLIEQSLNGNKHSFETLVDRHLDIVRAVAMANAPSPSDADDIVQDTFLIAYQRLRQLRDKTKLRNWLVVIARNISRAYRRRTASAAIPLDIAATISPDIDRADRAAHVRHVVEQLPPQHREVLLLHYFSGQTTLEIATALAISRDAVKKRLERARAAFNEELLRSLKIDNTHEDRERLRALVVTAVMSGVAASAMAQTISITTGALLGLPAAAGAIAACVVIAGSAFLVLPGISSEREVKAAADARPAAADNGATAPVEAVEIVEEPLDTDAAEPAATELELAAETQADLSCGDPEKMASFIEEVEKNTLRMNKMPVLSATMKESVDLEFGAIDLGTILETISEIYPVPFLYRPFASADNARQALEKAQAEEKGELPLEQQDLRSDGLVPYIALTDITVEEFLNALCRPLGLAFHAYPDYIYIATPQMIAEIGDTGEGVDLSADISVEFEDIHISSICSFVADSYQINIVLDDRAVRAPEKLQPAAPAESPLDTAHVPHWSMKQVSMEIALESLLKEHGLEFATFPSYVYVAPAEEIAKGRLPEPRTDGASDVLATLLNGNFTQIEVKTQGNVREALEHIAQETGICFSFEEDWKIYNNAVPFQAAGVPLRIVLAAILDEHSLKFQCDGDTIRIISK